MAKIYFEKSVCPCLVNPVTLWHLKHGWIWNITDQKRTPLGVFFCTLLCGDGVIVHFDTLKTPIPWNITLAAMKKGIRMLNECNVIFATIPIENEKLIRVALRLGFRKTSAKYISGLKTMVLLEYFKKDSAIL